MSIYNLIKYSDSHSKTSGSWSQYYKGDLNANLADYESFISKIKIGGCTSNDDNTKIVYIAVPLKYLSKFWRTLEMPTLKLISFKNGHQHASLPTQLEQERLLTKYKTLWCSCNFISSW